MLNKRLAVIVDTVNFKRGPYFPSLKGKNEHDFVQVRCFSYQAPDSIVRQQSMVHW